MKTPDNEFVNCYVFLVLLIIYKFYENSYVYRLGTKNTPVPKYRHDYRKGGCMSQQSPLIETAMDYLKLSI